MPKAKDCAPIKGYDNENIPGHLLRMNKHTRKGDWRRDRMIHGLHYKECTVTWSASLIEDTEPLNITSPVPVGMIGCAQKVSSQHCKNFQSLPVYVKEHFNINSTNDFNNAGLSTSTSFSEPAQNQFGDFYHLYCHICENKKLPVIWKKHADKLPPKMNIENLLLNWDKLGCSWMENDILGCLLPNNIQHYVFINCRRFLIKPYEHWRQVHNVEEEPTAKKMKMQIPKLSTFFTSKANSTTVMVNEIDSQSSSKVTCSKILQAKPKLKQQNISEMVQPTININHKPTTERGIDTWALGSMMMNVHTGVNKCISNNTIIDYHEVGYKMTRDYHSAVSSLERFSSLPMPPKVTLHDHNIVDVQKSLFETYRWENKDPNNPYRILEVCRDFSIMHDATSHWVKQLNTIMLRVISPDLEIIKIPFSFKNVPSLTGEVLCTEIIEAVSSIKKVKNNASEKIFEVLAARKQSEVEETYQQLCDQLKVAADEADFENLSIVQEELRKLIGEHPHLKSGISAVSTEASDDTAYPKPTNYFQIATIKEVDKAQKVIYLNIDPECFPTSQCGDGCSTNLKAARLVEAQIGLKSPFTRCSSHAASGTIKRLCTSETMCNDDAKSLYNNLRKLLKHFSMSNKNTDLLNKALTALEMNNVHILNWGSTRMAGFLEACVQASKIIVPFLDTIITLKIRPEETAYIGSAKGVYQLKLFDDLHQLFGNKFLHKVDADGDKILCCETYHIARKTAVDLENVATKNADALLESLEEDANRNLMVSFTLGNEVHTLRLNERITTRARSVETVKKELSKMKKEIIGCMVDNINDQNSEGSLVALMSAFDLNSEEGLESRIEKVSQLYDIYGVNNEHPIHDDWFGYQVRLTYKKRLTCTKNEILVQFRKAWPDINKLSKQLKDAKEKKKQLTQYELWKQFALSNEIGCRYLCQLISIMFSIPVNTGWIERGYSTLEMICQKRRNRLDVPNLRNLFFLAILKLPVRDAFSYGKEIQNIGKKFPGH